MEKIYLITGAAGHLGTALINELKDTPCKIRALCLVGEKHIPQGENVEIYYGDVCDKDTLCDFFGGLEGKRVLVVHCAGIVSISSKFMQKVYDVNVTGTKNIVDTCMDKGVARLVYVSSVHAIPEKRKKEIISEISDFSPDSVKGLYAKTKAEATAYVLDAARRGLDASVVFPAGIIGPFDYGRSHTNAIISDYVKKRLTAAIRGGYDFVDVRDVAKGIIQCAENGEKGNKE